MVDHLGENSLDTDLQVNPGQAEAYVNQLVTEKPHRMRRDVAFKLTAALAGAFFLGACGSAARPEATNVPPPPPAGAAEAAKPPHTSESEKQQEITVTGSAEVNPTDPTAETIRFSLSDGLVTGEKPLIPLQDTMELSFTLKTENPVNKVSVSLPEILGMADIPFSSDMAVGDTNRAMDMDEAIKSFIAMAKSKDPNFSLSAHDEKLLGLLGVNCSRTADGGLQVEISAPNRDIFYNTNGGRHRLNLAQQVASGVFGVGIAGEKGPGKVKAEHISIANMAGDSIAKPANFDFSQRTTIHPDATASATKPPENPTAATGTPETAGEDEEEKSKWITTEWADNQEVPLQEWWDDMESKGYIVIDDMARQFAPDKVAKIYDMVKNSNLIPKPVKYYEKGHAFINPCAGALQNLIDQGEGHITVAPEAFKLIPGGQKNCDIFTIK